MRLLINGSMSIQVSSSFGENSAEVEIVVTDAHGARPCMNVFPTSAASDVLAAKAAAAIVETELLSLLQRQRR